MQRNGLLIVKSFWDVLRLRQLGIASVGIMSDHITDEHLELACAVALARARATSRIGIMFDADEKYDEGAKDALWKQSELGLRTRLASSRQMFAAEINGRIRIDRT